jgi:hypothetical protein
VNSFLFLNKRITSAHLINVDVSLYSALPICNAAPSFEPDLIAHCSFVHLIVSKLTKGEQDISLTNTLETKVPLNTV